MDLQPFTIAIPQAELDELQVRLARARWPQELPGVGWNYGVPLSYVRRLAERWQNGYDWRAWEARINAYPQYTTEIDGQRIHFLHIRSPHPDALPLIVSHGWPGSIVEFFNVIDLLTNPTAHSGDKANAFHLVLPSLPGFAFSGPTHEQGWNPERIARAWIELMHGLGYAQYGALGNDWGSFISPLVGRLDPEHVVGTYVTQIFLLPSGDPAELAAFTPEDLQALEGRQWFEANMSAYDTLQSQQPQTLAFALHDSPVGLLAWMCQIYREGIDDDFVLTNASIYWLTDTIASSARIYYEHNHAAQLTEPTTIPIGLGMFKHDLSFPTLAKRVYTNLIHWSKFEVGGHYAAHQAPDLLAGDVQRFFGPLR